MRHWLTSSQWHPVPDRSLTVAARFVTGRSVAILLACLLALLTSGFCAEAKEESFRAAGTEFNAQRSVTIPAGRRRPVVVTEFLHHGEITPDGRNVVVVAAGHKLVPVRVLQIGPGDFCRLAFETIRGETNYRILYGGEPPKPQWLPEWTNRDGLLLETRRCARCNLWQFESVRRAFESAEPIGAGYVDTVQHAANPFLLTPGPFMSRYHGTLRIGEPGRYTFWTSSQDCSFLLIDGQLVVDAPGRHWPRGRARPGSGKTIRLAAGPHEFDYYHVATGSRAMMVAAWVVGPLGSRPRPTLIPSEAFGAESIGRATAGRPMTRKIRSMPDFTCTITGDVPLPERRRPLVGVAFKDNSPPSLARGGSVRWDFGDGQTGDRPSVEHVYLRPGLYRVTLSRKRGIKTLSITNRIYVDRPYRTWLSKEKLHRLDDYLPVLAGYDPKTLDAQSLEQLVSAYLWKADLLRAKLEQKHEASAEEVSEEPRKDRPKGRRQKAKPKTRAKKDKVDRTKGAAETAATMRQYQKRAVEVGKTALLETTAANGDEDLLRLAKTIAPVARIDLGDSPLALRIGEGAAERIGNSRLRAQCQLWAAEVAVGDLLDARRGRALLEAATKELDDTKGPLASRLQRVWGDYYALSGKPAAARRAYAEAERLLRGGRNHNEQTARRGARSRSTEQFLRAGQWDRAVREIHRWQDEFPSDKAGGYLSLLYGRYWVGRQKHAQAIALAEQLVAINPDSPYADQLLWLAARSEERRGRADRAAAILNQLLKDYPGSLLVPEVKEKLRNGQ